MIELTDISVYHYGNYEAGFIATIENCKFVDSSFIYGMIFVPPNVDAYLS